VHVPYFAGVRLFNSSKQLSPTLIDVDSSRAKAGLASAAGRDTRAPEKGAKIP